MKQVEQTDTRIVKNMEERNVGTERKSPKQGLTSAEDLKETSPSPLAVLTL